MTHDPNELLRLQAEIEQAYLQEQAEAARAARANRNQAKADSYPERLYAEWDELEREIQKGWNVR